MMKLKRLIPILLLIIILSINSYSQEVISSFEEKNISVLNEELRKLKKEASLPKGVIILWSGTIASIPDGWALCDGNNGTVDLRDKFVVGAKQDDSGVAKTNVSGSLTKTGGAASGNLAHTHSVPRDGWGGSIDVVSGRLAVRSDGGGGSLYLATTNNTTGSGLTTQSFLPPYYALAFIQKI